jgi:hypothetical protein
MSNKSDIIKALKGFGKTDDEAYSVICTVDSVDLLNKTCYCLPLNEMADIMDVALIVNKKTGFMIVPTVGSLVMVSFQSKSNAFVSMFSEIDEIQLDGVSYGGLVKINDLKTQLNLLQTEINTLKTLVGTAIAVYSAAIDAGVSAATFNAAILPQINLTTLENTKVKHGNGL